MTRPRVLLADDHSLVIAGFSKLLDSDFDVVGTVGDGHALIAAARELRPDVILLDVSMPVMNGFDAARELTRAGTEAKLIFVTMHSDPAYVTEALRAGAHGYVLKRSAASELASAIREVLAGRPYITPLVSVQYDTRAGFELTPRQREVIRLVADGKSAKEIAAALGISVKTVEYHKSEIMRRLNVRSTAELTKYAIDRGITGI